MSSMAAIDPSTSKRPLSITYAAPSTAKHPGYGYITFPQVSAVTGVAFASLVSDLNGTIYLGGKGYIYSIDTAKISRLYAGSYLDDEADKNGHRLEARFRRIAGLCFASPTQLLITDSISRKIKEICGDQVRTIAGSGQNGSQDGPWLTSSFQSPTSITVCGDIVALIDDLQYIRLLLPNGFTHTLSLPQLQLQTNQLRGLATHHDNRLLVGTTASLFAIDLRINRSELLFPRDGDSGREFAFITSTHSGDLFISCRQESLIAQMSRFGTLSVLYGQAKHNFALAPEYFPTSQTFAPTALCMSSTGILWWAEAWGTVRYVNMPRHTGYNGWDEPHQPGFDAWTSLNSITTLSDSTIIHSQSSSTIPIHTGLFKLWGADMSKLKVLGDKNIPFEFLLGSVALLYGRRPPADSTNLALWAYASYIFDLIRLDSLQAWVDLQLLKSARFAPTLAILKLFSEMLPLVEGLATPIGSLCEALLSRQSEFDELDEELARITPTGLGPIMKRLAFYSPGMPDDMSVCSAARSPWCIWKERVVELWNGHTSIDPNFTFAISGRHPVTVMVHDWLILAKWTYFARMIDSGMTESTTRRAELPLDFPPILLPILMQYLYTGYIDNDTITKSMADFVLSNGGAYHLLDLEGNPCPGFAPLIACCRNLTSETACTLQIE